MVSFELRHEIDVRVGLGKIVIPHKVSNLRIPRSDTLPVSRRDSMVTKAHYEPVQQDC